MSALADSSSLLSFSANCLHSVRVTHDGLLIGIGDNRNGRISNSLPRKKIEHLTKFSIDGGSSGLFTAVSAVCLSYGTLYLLADGRAKLVLFHEDVERVILDTGNKEPVALFGGLSFAAAISKDGEVIIINPSAVMKPGGSSIEFTPLPISEKAVHVACCEDFLFVLSSGGRVFMYPIDSESNAISFSAVTELERQEIVYLSGTHKHCIAVSIDDRVFVRGSNSDGQLGLGNEAVDSQQFVQIVSLNRYEISSAYAGGFHSLFVTREGKVLACGNNGFGQLFLSSPGDNVYLPVETTITSGATFCIAMMNFSVIFIDGDPPPNTPNRPIDEGK